MKIDSTAEEELLNKRIAALSPAKCATLIYTSGTTGKIILY